MYVWVKNVPTETARGQNGESGACVRAPVASVSSSASAASSPLELMGPGVQASSTAIWRTASATSAPAVVRQAAQ